MREIKTDLLVLGAGPGGYVAAIYAARKGLNVVIVDGKYIGGTCLNVGCIPTKALVKSAELYQEILDGEKYGVFANDAKIDLNKVIDRKEEVKSKLVNGVEFLLNKHNVEVVKGYASFIDNKKVKIESEDLIVEAKDIIIATGSKTKHLPIPGIDSKLVIDSTALLENRELPESMTVIGGGIIGMEFAFIYASMGVKVNVVEFLPRILPGIDKELSQRLLRFAKKLNIDIYTSSEVKKIETENNIAKVYFARKEKENVLESSLVLEAVGRVPNMVGLGLENTEVEYNERKGIKVNDKMETNIKNIYAIGDVTNIIQLAHVASHQALVAVNNIIGKETHMDYDAVPSVIFTMPTIATVGMSEEMAKEKAIEIDVAKVPFSSNGKELIMDSETGYLKLIRRTKDQVLIGAMIFGKDAENLIAPLTLAIKNNLSTEAIKETIFAHPTTQEMVHEAALGLDSEAIHFL